MSYTDNVLKDIKESKEIYPYIDFVFLPVNNEVEIKLKAIVVNKQCIEELNLTKEELLKDYSKQVDIIVPYDYKEKGCTIYIPSWVNLKRIPNKDHHFNEYNGRKVLCLGVPESFKEFSNVLLENLKTTDSLLSAYELFLKGITDKVEINAYSHGSIGIKEYKNDKKRYESR